MTVESIIGGKLGDENDKFPVGMRVLAVDDDMTCLKLLERLLQKCQYQVTTTNEAKVALEMLRENRNRFDIIITDVHMPDMDGLKLLELVGLEMDLPVIMLSVNSDPKLVMKGITHGACDYLVKPVRLEELKNIWQHVIRKKKREPRQISKTDHQEKNQQINGESGNRSCSNGGSDQNGERSNRKRKDDDKQEDEQEEDDEEADDNGTESDEPNAQKKSRVVWSMDLHKKFVQAVNQLGIGKGAVPKRILEHMNVEGLTRENVASHLQKYRLYLRRINSVATQANINDPYMRINSFNRVADLSALATSQGRFFNSAMSSYQTGAMLNRLNTPSGGNLFSTSSPIQTNNLTQNISNSFSTLSKLNPVVLQTNNGTSYPGNINLIAGSIHNIPSAQKSILSSAHNGGIFSNQNSEPLNANTGSNNLNNGVFMNFLSNESFSRNPLVPNGIIENNTFSGGHILNNPNDFSSTNVISTSVHDSRGDGLFGHFINTNNVVTSPFSHSFDQNNRFSQRKPEMPLMNVQNSSLPTFLHQNGSEKLAIEPKTKPNGDYFLEQWRSQGGFGPTGFDALDELQMNLMTKVDQEGNMVMDGEFGVDAYIK